MDRGKKKNRKPVWCGFRRHLYEMLDDHSTDSIVSWGEGGKSLIVWNESEFLRKVLPVHTQYNDMGAFLRRLRSVGFKKIEESQHWEYACDDFERDHREPQPSLEEAKASLEKVLERINRRKMVQAARRVQI